MNKLVTTSITPADLLDGARTIPLGAISTCDWLSEWVPSAVLLQWAERGLAEGDAYGLSNAVTYAKRAAACRIDFLLRYNHLLALPRSTFPAKIAALRKVGLGIPDVVHELVIDPRNALEHNYEVPREAVARHAVGVADLFVRATDAEWQRSSIVAVAWNVLGSQTISPQGYSVHFRGFSDRPMLFIDVFNEPSTAKIVDPNNSEIRCAHLSNFSDDQSLEMAQLLRSNYERGSLSRSGSSRTFFEEMKRQGGF